MFTARPIAGAIQVNVAYPLDRDWWLEITCLDYEHYTNTPHALEFDGRRYGRTGWNSDRCVAYYTTRQAFAVAV